MDIVVCGAQVPFMRGGAELHMENLVAALSRSHRAELVRLPAAWEKDRLLDSALAWRLVPIDADLVIATNFPSYYVRHPRKRVWLFHQHRGAYDGADAVWSDFGLDDDSLETQRLLSDWDVRALEEAECLFTTSARVADRLARYNGLLAEPLYHPPPLHDRLHSGPFGDYVFCPTRLEHNKRPQLVVEGLARSTSGVRAVLAGRGSLEGELRQQAKRLGIDDRLELPGFVSDEELVTLYAGCRAVVYAPFDEDYGYVTLQAYYAAKPVITASDSGGVLEWVDDGVTGLVTDGSPEAVADAIDRLAGDDALARRLGQAGQARVADLGWHAVVERLTAP
jgi:glycosyltransferase involved in cell wall biosynthesis